MKKIKSLFFAAFSVLLVLIAALLPAFEVNAEFFKTDKPLGNVFAIAYFGNCEKYPKGSLLSIFSCINSPLAGVSVTVQKTSDDQLVVAEEDSLKKITGEDKNISQLTYRQLSAYKLLNPDMTKSYYSFARLDGVLAGVRGKMIVIVDCKEEIVPLVAKVINSADRKSNVYIRCKLSDSREISGKTQGIPVVPYKKGNVIFSSVSLLNDAEKNGSPFAQFATKNKYGVIFSQMFTRKFGKTKGLFSFADKDICGDRPDTAEGWENIIRCGYSYIESANASELCQYLEMLNDSVEALSKSIDISKRICNTKGSKALPEDLQKAIKSGEEIVNSGKAVCVSDVYKIRETIDTKTNEFRLGETPSKGVFKITLPKILWTVFVIALFVAATLYIKKKTKK